MLTRIHPRRDFLKRSSYLVSGGALSLAAGSSAAGAAFFSGPSQDRSSPGGSQQPTIQQVIDLIIGKCVDKPLQQTVDTVKTGDPSQNVRGIVTTFLATCDVIEKTASLGANLIITHEPTFYSHLDETDWLKSDPVYISKRRLIDENRIVIWRFHDYWHRHKPDGIMTGVLKELGWENYADSERHNLCTIPATSLRNLAAHLKEKLGGKSLQVVGNGEMTCRRVAFLVGAAGGRMQMLSLASPEVDVVVVGEINEWETSEYARDAACQKKNKALIILGHANSEEPGMKYLAEWLRPLLPGIKITFVPAGDPFQLM
jgi:putative NIF3 family GTP cyclohydrolase 1 type 2